MTPTELFEQRHCRQRRPLAQQRHQFLLPHPGQRVGTRAPPPRPTAATAMSSSARYDGRCER
jgi:hypothetical protein